MLKGLKPWVVTVIIYATAIVAINLVIMAIYCALTGGLSASNYTETLANVLFPQAALVFTIGAFFEFFIKDVSHKFGRSMMFPYEEIVKRIVRQGKGGVAVIEDRQYSAGWMLIATGGLLIIASLAFAYISMQ